MNRLKRLYRPEIYQGRGKKGPYFEGWYYKHISQDRENCYSFIPGICLTKDGKDDHSFIQILNGTNGESHYIEYPASEFWASKDKLEVKIGDSVFTKEGLSLNIKSEDFLCKGTLSYKNIISYPTSTLNPGIMGWYSFVPFMECYHGVVNIDHDIEGKLEFKEGPLDFSEGKGYIEKDWGKSFPSSWIWIQSNSFSSEASLMLSIAKIPWLGYSFVGFLSFLYVKGKIYSFATYNGSKVNEISYENNLLRIEVSNSKNKLEILASMVEGGNLRAPTQKGMERRIKESINSIIKVTLTNANKCIVFEDTGFNTGLEICGDIKELIP